MTDLQWRIFSRFRDEFRKKCLEWEKVSSPWLRDLQMEAASAGGTPPYPVETSVVYNRALDGFSAESKILLIIVSDNPGKEEQLAENNMYLVGQAGKLGAGFFSKHPEMGIDFRKNVIILNKTPVHSARTKQLEFLLKNGGHDFSMVYEESQRWMAEKASELKEIFDCPLWLVGYGELRPKGLFSKYAETLTGIYTGTKIMNTKKNVYLFQHFSMNRFAIDLRDSIYIKGHKDLPVTEKLALLGESHRKEILGW